MKKILVCADFSPESRHCARYALLLASALNTELFLLHVIETGGDHSSAPLLLEPFEVLEGRALEMLCDLRLSLDPEFSNAADHHSIPEISIGVRMGDLKEIADDMFFSGLVSMACIGKRKIGSLLLPASTGSRMRKAASLPMLFVPLTTPMYLPAKMGLSFGTVVPKGTTVSFINGFCALAGKIAIIVCPRQTARPVLGSLQEETERDTVFKGIPPERICYLHIRKRNTRETEFLIRDNGIQIIFLLTRAGVEGKREETKISKRLILQMGVPVMMVSQ